MPVVLSSANPKKWWEVATGNEQDLFKELARGEKPWRTARGLASVVGMKSEDVLTILENYIGSGIISQKESKESDEKLFRYWERTDGNPPKSKDPDSIVESNQKARIQHSLKGSGVSQGNSTQSAPASPATAPATP